MRPLLAALIFAIAPVTYGAAQTASPAYDEIIETAIEDHILPGLAGFSAASARLSDTAPACGGDETPLRTAYHGAFDAWMGVSHLRMGPMEENDAAFAIAFWPDPRGFRQRTLNTLIADRDAAVDDPTDFAEVSIAARGLFALERLLFDPAFGNPQGGYRCRLITAIATDLAGLANGVEQGWRERYADALRGAGGQAVYADEEQAVQSLYAAMKTGVEFTLNARIDHPLEPDGRARPNRAEAWRSERSNRNIELSLAALSAMFEDVFAAHMAPDEAEIIREQFAYLQQQTDGLPAPLRTLVAEPLGRGRLVTLRFALMELAEQMEVLLRPALGLSISFNALDGD